MGDIIMILNLLSAINLPTTTNMAAPEPPKIHLEKIAQGMNKKDLIKAFGKPSRTEPIHNFYSGVDSVRYYYENEPCTFTMHSCTVDVTKGKITEYHDVKDDLIASE